VELCLDGIDSGLCLRPELVPELVERTLDKRFGDEPLGCDELAPADSGGLVLVDQRPQFVGTEFELPFDVLSPDCGALGVVEEVSEPRRIRVNGVGQKASLPVTRDESSVRPSGRSVRRTGPLAVDVGADLFELRIAMLHSITPVDKDDSGNISKDNCTHRPGAKREHKYVQPKL